MTLRTGAIVVLGAPNDEDGNLSSIAVERCNQALREYRRHPGFRVIPTGGWGPHFNTTDRPHGFYTRQYLMAHGVPDADILPCIESANTVEDAKFCRSVVAHYGFAELIVVTSDFHIPRAQYLFEYEFPDKTLSFSGASTFLSEDELQTRREHETRALARVMAQHETDT